MEISLIHTAILNTEESILSSTLSKSNEVVMLMSSGNVFRYNLDTKEVKHLFSVESSFSFEDGGFDINAKTSLYTLNSIVVIVNDYKRHGYVHYPNKYRKLHLHRQDYHADISCYPISLFENDEGIPLLIYGKAWNHLQIINLNTRQILTATKSLIEENAEEDHLEFYKNHKEDNKLSWPSPYDYFYGKLQMSPDKKQFLSAGWVWGSYDAYKAYEVKHFIENSRIKHKNVTSGEHYNRAVCWIDNKTIAVTYHPCEEEDENSTMDSSQEIHFYKVGDTESEIMRKIKVKGIDMMNSIMHFNVEFNCIVLLSDLEGVVVLSIDGTILLQDKELNSVKYNSRSNQFIKTDGQSIFIYRMQ